MQIYEKPWKLVLAFAFFAVIALGLLLVMLLTGGSMASGGGAIMLLAAITWGTAALMLYAFVRQRMRVRALRRGR